VGRSLLEILRDVAVDPAEQAALAEVGAAPYLARHGFHDVDVEDVREAVDLVADTLPPEVARTLTFAGRGLAPAPGQPGDVHVGAFGDVTDRLDGMPSHHIGDVDSPIAHGDWAPGNPLAVTDAADGDDSPLTFGAGAEPPSRDHAIGLELDGVDPELGPGPGAPEGLAMTAPQGEAVAAHDLGRVGVDPTDLLTNDVGDLADVDDGVPDDMPDDPGVLDDIGSF
jgi:hypothetical protein